VWGATQQVNSGFFYSSADQREKLIKAERKFTDERVEAVIALKKKVRLFACIVTHMTQLIKHRPHYHNFFFIGRSRYL
jgi:hypothetical protein